MEMVETKVIALLAAAALFCGCSERFTWRAVDMDGHRTGVTAVVGDNVPEALGVVDSVYHSPNGTVFACGSTPAVAALMLDAQPEMAYLREVLGYCPGGMTKDRPESELSNWAVDAIMLAAESVYGRKVDVGLMNMGGIRVDMPDGEILLDDLVSMFPFRNHVVYVSLRGEELRHIFGNMAEKSHFEAVGGVRIVASDGKLESVLVGGEPLDDDKVYGLATIDFLLEGGDGIYAARNAVELLDRKVLIRDWIVPYVRTMNASGEMIKAYKDGRVTVK